MNIYVAISFICIYIIIAGERNNQLRNKMSTCNLTMDYPKISANFISLNSHKMAKIKDCKSCKHEDKDFKCAHPLQDSEEWKDMEMVHEDENRQCWEKRTYAKKKSIN